MMLYRHRVVVTTPNVETRPGVFACTVVSDIGYLTRRDAEREKPKQERRYPDHEVEIQSFLTRRQVRRRLKGICM